MAVAKQDGGKKTTTTKESNKQAIQNINRTGTVSGKSSGVKGSSNVVRTNTDTSNLAGNNRQQALGTPKAQSAKTTATSSYSNALGKTSNQEKGKTYVPDSTNKNYKAASKTSSDIGKENQQYQINQHQEKLDRAAQHTSEKANALNDQRTAERNARVAQNPNYEYNFYEFSDGNGNVLSGQDYINKVSENNQGFENVYQSFQLLEDQYKKDGDYAKYLNGYNELMNTYDGLVNEYESLSTYTGDYNNSTKQQYESNRSRMQDIIRETAYLKKNGGSRQQIEALDAEYMALKDQTEQLKTLYEDIENLKENDYYQWLKENRTEEEVRDYESYMASEADTGVLGFAKNRAKALSANLMNPAYAVTSLADISRDLLGDAAGSLMDSVAQSLNEKGFIDDESFSKVMEVSRQLKEFEYDNDNNLSQALRRYREKVNLEINSGNKSDFELIAGEMIDSALENYIRYETMGEVGTYAMALTTFSDSYKECIDKGYSPAVALTNASMKAYITWWSENLSTERYFQLAGSVAGSSIDKMFFSVLAERMVAMVPEEGIEEGAEYIADYAIDLLTSKLQPGIDTPVFSKGDLLKGSLIAMGSTAISGVAGAFTSVMNYENPVPAIANGKDYAQFNTELEYVKQLQKEEANIEVKNALQRYINDAERQKLAYENISMTAGSVVLSDDNASLPSQQDADNTYKQGMVPEAVADSNEQEKIDNEVMEASEFIRSISQNYLAQNGIAMSVEEYLSTDQKTRESYKQATDILNKAKVRNSITRLFSGQNGIQMGENIILNSDQTRTMSFNALADLDEKAYKDAMKFDKNGIAKDTNSIFKVAGSDASIVTSAIHELLHYAEKSGLWADIKNLIVDSAGKNRFEIAKNRLNDIYKGRGVMDASAEREAAAFFIQENIDQEAFLKALATQDSSLMNRLYNNLVSSLTGESKSQMERLFAKAIKSAQREYKREARSLYNSQKGGYVGQNFISQNKLQLSVAQWELTGKDILEDYLKSQSDLSEETKTLLMERMEEIAKVMKDFEKTGKFPEFSKWQDTTYSIDREGNFSVVITNGDYEMNIDFSTVCKKRKMMDKVLNQLSKQGYLNTALTQQQLTQLRQIIQDEGMEVACGLCFVDAKRFNQGNWAGRFETKWNKLIDQVAGLAGLDEDADISTFGVATGYETSPVLADIDFSDPKFKSFVELSKGGTEEALMARAIINDPDLRGYVSTDTMYSSAGFEQLKSKKPKLYDLVNNSGGSSKPKLAHTEILYTNEIVNDGKFVAEDAKKVGGVRVQSFSDFMTNMVFDYVQMFADMEAKQLTGHSYTKVKEYALLFGKTGMRINLSIIPAGFDSSKYTAEDIRELRKNNRKEWDKLRENAGLDENGNYMFDQESFDWDLALEIQNLDGYDQNVGTICVGVSDKHIWKMLDDDNVCMIIPYHRSGINPEVALAMGINVFNDYTKKQNTCFKKPNGKRGRKVGIDFNWYSGMTMDDGTHFKGMIENDYDAKATADEYLSWCEANDYVPKFDAFMDHPNYYKLLIDFRAYDKNGNVAKQNPVKVSDMQMGPNLIDVKTNPKLAEIYGDDTGFNNVLQKGLETYESNEATQNEKLDPITEKAVKKLGLKKNNETPKSQLSIGSYKAVERLVESDDPDLQERGNNLLEKHIEAVNMENEGYDMEEIWEKTGFIKKADGKWRFQFYDGAEDTIEEIAKFVRMMGNGNTQMLNGKNVYIEDFMKPDNVIFAMYPELRKLTVHFEKGKDINERGSYGNGMININLSPYGTRIDEEGIESIANTFFHELQHAIQKIEGLEGGSNLALAAEEYMTEVGQELLEEHSKLVEKLYKSGVKDVKNAIDDYMANKLTKNFEHNFTEGQLSILRKISSVMDRVQNIGMFGETQEAFDRYWNNLGEKEAREEAENALLDADIRSWVSPDTEGYLKSEAIKSKYNLSNSLGEQYTLGEETPLGETEMSDEQMNLKSRVPTAKDLSEQKTARVLEKAPEYNKSKDAWKRAKTVLKGKTISRYAAVEELADQTKNKKLVPLLDEVMRAQGRANVGIYEGLYDKAGKKKIGKSLVEIMGKIPQQYRHAFDEYMYHWRNVDEMSMADRFAKKDLEAINKQLKELKKNETLDKKTKNKQIRELEKRKKELNKIKNRPVFGKDVTAEDSMDWISEIEQTHPEFREIAEEMWELNRQYLKMRQDSGIISEDTYNDFIEKRPHYIPIIRDVGGSGVSAVNPNDIRKFKGSTRDILPLEDAMKRHILKSYQATSQNDLNNEIIQAYGGGEKIDSDELIDLIDEGFNPAVENPDGKQIAAYKNGEKIMIPVSDEMYDALAPQKMKDSALKEVADQSVAKLSKWRKSLLTNWNPIFSIFTNPMRDIQDAFGQTKYGGARYLRNLIKAAHEVATDGELSKQYDNLGISQSQYVGKDVLEAYEKMQSDKGMKKFLNNLTGIGEAIEKIPRLAEFISSVEAGNDTQQAAYDAAEITTNFKRGGTTVKNLDKYGFPFLNASVQGFDKQVRNAKGDIQKIKDNGIKGVISVLARLTLASGIPLRLLQDWLWKDDDDYKELSDYIKSRYYIVAKTNGRFVRIPKGRVAAFWQTVIDGGYKLAKEQTDVWNMLLDDWQSFADNVAPNSVADSFIGSPLIQAHNNKSWYGEDIVPTRLQGLPDSEQYDESTDYLSIALGELSRKIADATGNDKFELSPYKINYVLDQYSGVLGDLVLPAITLKTDVGVDNPFLKGAATAILDKFTTDPILKNQNVSTFYDLMDDLKVKSNSKYAEPEQILSYKYLSSVATEMGKLYGKKRDIQASKELTNKEKVEKTRKIQQEINVFAKAGLANYDNIDIEGKYAAVGGVQYYQSEDGSWRKTRKETLEKMNDADLSMEDRGYYFETSSQISDIRNKIKKNTPEGQRADYAKDTIDAINNSKLSAKGKNALYDSYYDSKATKHINNMDLSDEQKLNLKIANNLAEGKKDKNGKTISNSKAEATAEAYDKLGLLDDVLKYIKDNDIAPSEMGLSKTVYNKLIKSSSYQSAYNSSMNKKSSSKSKKGSSKSSNVSGGSSGIRKAGKLNKLAPVTSKSLINDRKIANGASNYMKAYASVFNRSGKKPNTGGRAASVTCPRCGSSVSAANGKCPVCGANL